MLHIGANMETMDLITRIEALHGRRKSISLIVGFVFICMGPFSFASLSLAYDITIIKSREAVPYDLFLKEFTKVLPEVNIRIENMYGDINKGKKIIDGIGKNNTDLVLVLGPKAAWVTKHEREIPVVFSMLSNPEQYSLGNLAGVRLNFSAEQYLENFRKIMPGVIKIGVIYSKDNNEFIEEAGNVAKQMGMEILGKEVNELRGVQAVVDELLPKIDVLWIYRDPVVTGNPKVVKQIILLRALRKNVPIIGANKWSVKNGALFSLFTEYQDIGRQAGMMVKRMLKGGGAEVEPPSDIKVFFNQNVIERLSSRVKLNVPRNAFFAK